MTSLRIFALLSVLAYGLTAQAQAPQGGLSPLAPPASVQPAPARVGPGAPPAAAPNDPATLPVPPQAAAPARVVAPPPMPDPVLFVVQGLEGVLDAGQLTAKLSEALGRELVSLVDPRASQARATVWLAFAGEQLVVRVTPPQRPEVWRRLARAELGADPVATVSKVVLDMFWADAFARLDAAELQDPFCPPGLICVDARRSYPWPPVPEQEVLDPWDSSYRRFYGWDPFSYPQRYPASVALTAPQPGRHVRSVPVGSPYWGAPPAMAADDHPYALSVLAGGGVHKGGAFFRYELDAVRRFPRFDFGLAFIGARGQPEPPTKARRAITALLLRRFVAQDFELDLGASFGTFFATFEAHPMEVRPYLRGMVTFALPVGRLFDFLVQSDLATTFASVNETGAVEYALSLGLRHRM